MKEIKKNKENKEIITKNKKVIIQEKKLQALPIKIELSLVEKNNDFIKNLYQKIEDFLLKELSVETNSKILLAVSGGVDSVVMLDIFYNLRLKNDYELFIVHYNHKIRDNSDLDEKLVRQLAETYNLPIHTTKGKVKEFAKNNLYSIEHAARILRYRFFDQTSKSLKISIVATAHTANDSAETFLLNLIRGTGLTGLSGIPKQRILAKKVKIIRPIINIKKDELLKYAKMRKLIWREDETNSMTKYTRNKIRLELIPKLENDFNPTIIDTINRTANLIYGADKFIENEINTFINSKIVKKNDNDLSLRISSLITLDKFISGEIIQNAISSYFNTLPISLDSIDRIYNLINSHIGTVYEFGNIIALRDRYYLIFTKKDDIEYNYVIENLGEFKIGNYILKLSEINKKDIDFNNNPNIEYFDKELIPTILYVKSWKQGDKFQPLGMNTDIKISDFYINNKIPLTEKKHHFLLATKTDIIWVCGMRISDKYKITENTKKFIKAELIKEKNENK